MNRRAAARNPNPKTPLGDDFETVDALCSKAIDSGDELSEFEINFVMRLAPRLDRYGKRTMLSAKQRGVIKRVAERLGEPAPW